MNLLSRPFAGAAFLLVIAASPAQNNPGAIRFFSAPEVPLFSGDFSAPNTLQALVRQLDNSMLGMSAGTHFPFPVSTTANFQTRWLKPNPNATRTGQKISTAPVPGAGSQILALADFMGDGSYGGAYVGPGNIAGFDQNHVYTFVVNADGSLRNMHSYAVGSQTSGVIAADFNGDGKPDLAVACLGAKADVGQLWVLLGNGDGTFQPAVQYKAGSGPIALAAADFNGDGNLDLAAANSNDGTVSMLFGKGDGTFQKAATVQAGENLLSIAAADLDGDGKPDLAVTDASAVVIVLHNRGTGTFGVLGHYNTGALPLYVAIGDFNKDGKPDLAVADSQNNSVTILTGNGDGTFQDPVNYVVGYSPNALVITDFDGDGNVDVVVGTGNAGAIWGNFDSGTVTVLYGNGDGTFQGAPLYPTGEQPMAIATADFNGDGKLDVITADRYSDQLSVFLGDGKGGLRAGTPLALPVDDGAIGPVALVVGDFNHDGKMDVAIAAAFSNQVLVALGKGNGTFQTPVAYSTGPGPASLVMGDFNGDGVLDLAVAYAPLDPTLGNGGVSIFLGNRNGTFTAGATYSPGANPLALSVGDFNGDGKADLAVVNNGAPGSDPGGITILLGSGDGSFQTGASYAAGLNPVAIAAADYNGDKKSDLAVATANADGSYALALAIGNGDGTFQTPTLVPTDFGAAAIAIADFNVDGKPDLIVAHCCGASDMTYLLGNGDGTFQKEVHFMAGLSPDAIAVADFNGDKKPDLAVADASGSVTMLVNLSQAATAGNPNILNQAAGNRNRRQALGRGQARSTGSGLMGAFINRNSARPLPIR